MPVYSIAVSELEQTESFTEYFSGGRSAKTFALQSIYSFSRAWNIPDNIQALMGHQGCTKSAVGC